MEIVDVNFNFEIFEGVVQKWIEKFNNVIDKVGEMKMIWECSKDLLDISKTNIDFQTFYKQIIGDDGGEAFNFAYKMARSDVKGQVIDAIADLKVATKNMENAINNTVLFMKARVNYIESTHSQDELYGNYKLREERNRLNRDIKQYEKIRDINLERANAYNLEAFGLEVDGEPDL